MTTAGNFDDLLQREVVADEDEPGRLVSAPVAELTVAVVPAGEDAPVFRAKQDVGSAAVRDVWTVKTNDLHILYKF